MEAVCPHTKQKHISKRHAFRIENCFEDVKQDEKQVPDLLEAIIQPPGPVKEELQQKFFKMRQFGSKIKKIRVCTFQMSGKIPDSTNVAFEAVISSHLHQILTHPHPLFAIFGRANGKIFEKTTVLSAFRRFLL